MSVEQDKAFVRTFVGVIAALVGITIFLIILASSMIEDENPELTALQRERAEARLQPVAAVRMSGEAMPALASAQPEPAAAAGPMSAEQVVQTACVSCHGAGVLGAPKIGSQADWEPRLQAGFDTLVQNAINGIRAMPPKGGNPALSEDDIRAAVSLMLEQSGLSAQ